MTAYRVWICDPIFDGSTRKGGGQIHGRGLLLPVINQLKTWLDPIAKGAGFSGGAEIIFPRYQAHVAVHEMLCYVMPDSLSVVKNKPGVVANFPNPNLVNEKGATDPNAPVGSEIWMKSGVNHPNIIASLIFHELMHNKLRKGASLHGMFHSPNNHPPILCEMSCVHMNPPTSGPTPQEAAAMTQALKNPVPQWTDGQFIMFEARASKIKGDPVWNAALKP